MFLHIDAHRSRHARRRAGFTLVELLVVIGIIAALIGILMPALSKARQASARTKCLAQVRSMAMAQATYAVDHKGLLIAAGSGSMGGAQGSWIKALEPYSGKTLARRCPADNSPYFDSPLPGASPPANRQTSYGVNNYVSPTHAPPGVKPIKKLTQVKYSAAVIQFAELAETGSYAGADHLHVQEFFLVVAPQATLAMIDKQMPTGRHGGRPRDWGGLLNFSFLDGHAESLTLRDAYNTPQENRFDPAVAK